MNKTHHYLLLILIAVLPTFSFGQEGVTKHRIDVWLQQTLSKTSSTADMRAATNRARENVGFRNEQSIRSLNGSPITGPAKRFASVTKRVTDIQRC